MKTEIAVKKRSILKKMRGYWEIYLWLIPVAAFFIMFCYVPMYGVIIAFKNYLPKTGIINSPWIGLENFERIFVLPDFKRAFWNTLIISACRILFTFPMPIALALLLNELKFAKYKKFIQTAIYVPFFISWLIIGGLVRQLLGTDSGIVNNMLVAVGRDKIPFLTTPSYFIPILLISEIWKGAGWGTIIYIAAISGVNPELYDAAEVDGCKRWGKMRHVTLPCISATIVILLMLSIANVMNAGFDPIFNLYNSLVYSRADIIDTYVYRIGIADGDFSMGAAVGLFKSLINFTLLITVNALVKKINGVGIYD